MSSYPVWVEINSCIYKGKKSYGVRKHSKQEVRIGTSSSNSHHFADVEINHRERENGDRVYTIEIDGKTVKKAIIPADQKEPQIVFNLLEE